MNKDFVKAIKTIDTIKHAMERFDHDTLQALMDLGYGYTHLIGAGISCSGRISDNDLLKIAKCIIGNVNYRNHVPADDNNALMDTIDSISDKYVDK